MVVAIDFDGTCVAGYPKLYDIGAAPVLEWLVKHGHLLVLNTLRTGKELDIATDWFADHRIPLYGVNRCPGQEERFSTKVYADLYLDDRAFGAPLLWGGTRFGRFFDWKAFVSKFCPSYYVTNEEAKKDLSCLIKRIDTELDGLRKLTTTKF